MPQETGVFTSWKEIAAYLGKAVRTVQRWEAEFGLPIRWPDIKPKGTVRATKDELDGWTSTRWKLRDHPATPSGDNELETLRRMVAEFANENARLKGELEELTNAKWRNDSRGPLKRLRRGANACLARE